MTKRKRSKPNNHSGQVRKSRGRTTSATLPVLQYPTIFKAILEHSDRATLAICMRLSKASYDPSAAELYRHIRLHGRKLQSFLSGHTALFSSSTINQNGLTPTRSKLTALSYCQVLDVSSIILIENPNEMTTRILAKAFSSLKLIIQYNDSSWDWYRLNLFSTPCLLRVGSEETLYRCLINARSYKLPKRMDHLIYFMEMSRSTEGRQNKGVKSIKMCDIIVTSDKGWGSFWGSDEVFRESVASFAQQVTNTTTTYRFINRNELGARLQESVRQCIDDHKGAPHFNDAGDRVISMTMDAWKVDLKKRDIPWEPVEDTLYEIDNR